LENGPKGVQFGILTFTEPDENPVVQNFLVEEIVRAVVNGARIRLVGLGGGISKEQSGSRELGRRYREVSGTLVEVMMDCWKRDCVSRRRQIDAKPKETAGRRR
jgi:hypothetical protein